ncbi:stage II sporulation protein P [Neobacillus sp. D3-1R]|uniref:stage II sporulation protein P n=1 Tax=Neobacillus sp. D3-1R TaxID=3445778 RepID=UPI003F9ED227
MSNLKNLLMIPVLIIFLFLIPTIISISDKNFLNNSINDEIVTTDLLLTFLSFENASLRTDMNKEGESILIKSINVMNNITNIKMNNLLSYIQNEIPGYKAVKEMEKGEMYLAFESAPPLEELKRERDLATENSQLSNEVNLVGGKIQGQGKKVFIYHTHSWESYTSSDNPKVVPVKITEVGEMLGKALEQKGISAVVDKTNISQELEKKGWPSNQSYQISRNIVETVMAQHNDLEYFIDLHRDSARKEQTTFIVNKKPYARIVFVIGEENNHFEKNLKLAKELNQFLNANYPGVSKGILGKYGDGVDGVYNQDLSPNSLVIEVGGVDNNETEITNTVKILAEAISQQYWQAVEVNGSKENDYSAK